MSPIVLPKQGISSTFGGNIVAHTVVVVDGKFLLLQRAKDGRSGKAGEWDLPGGAAKIGETPQVAAARETLEETGLTVKVREPLTITSRLESMVALEPLVIMVFHATVEAPVEVTLSREHKAYQWVAKDEVKRFATVSYVASAVESAETQGFL